LKIDWEINESDIILSEKDTKLKVFKGVSKKKIKKN